MSETYPNPHKKGLRQPYIAIFLIKPIKISAFTEMTLQTCYDLKACIYQ